MVLKNKNAGHKLFGFQSITLSKVLRVVFDNDITYLHTGLAAMMTVLDNREGRLLRRFLPSWSLGDEER